MGKKGAERSADSKAFRKSDEEAKLNEAAIEQAQAYSVNAEGDVLPPDPKTIADIQEGLRG